MNSAKLTAPRNLIFICFIVLSIIVFWKPLSALLSFSWHDVEYSHIILISLISIFLVFYERRKIFSEVSYGFGVGTSLLLLGGTLYRFAEEYAFPSIPVENLTPRILGIVILWVGGFAFCYGTRAFRAAAFSLLFLFLMVPVPGAMMDQPILFVQRASAEVADLLFNLTGVPVFRNGFMFSLPGLNIEVAKECSGIHSTLSLCMVSLIAGHLCLRSAWRKIFLMLAIFPIVSVTNGLRIFVISVLSAYVSRSFLSGNLHHNGGVIFFLLALALLTPVFQLFRKAEALSGLLNTAIGNGDDRGIGSVQA